MGLFASQKAPGTNAAWNECRRNECRKKRNNYGERNIPYYKKLIGTLVNGGADIRKVGENHIKELSTKNSTDIKDILQLLDSKKSEWQAKESKEPKNPVVPIGPCTIQFTNMDNEINSLWKIERLEGKIIKTAEP